MSTPVPPEDLATQPSSEQHPREHRADRPRNQTPLIIGMVAVIVALVLGLWQLFTSASPDPGTTAAPGASPGSVVDGESDGTGASGEATGATEPGGAVEGTDAAGAGELPLPEGTYEVNAELAALARGEADDPRALGSPEAPVTMMVYSDFHCPFCARFSLETLPDLQEYVDAGHLRVEWRDFAVLGEESVEMATAAQAAARQGAFWEYHDWLYENQPPRGAGVVTDAWLTEAAGQLGLDTEQFAADLADQDESIWSSLIEDGREALQFSQGSTPAFVINGVVIIGAHPTQAFEDAIFWAFHNT